VDDRNELLTGRVPDFDSGRALERLRERAAREGVTPRSTWGDALGARIALTRGLWLRPLAAAASVAVVVTMLTLTGVAQTILTVFEPRQVATISVDPSELSGVPDPSQYGTLTWVREPSEWRAVADAGAAAKAAGFEPLVPAALPAGISGPGTFSVMDEAAATFRFDEAKAREAAARVGATAPPMPAAIAATTLTMHGGPAVMQTYGTTSTASRGIPESGLMIVQARAPVVTSDGATVEELRDYALAQPGVPPSVAAQIRAIGDPVRTLMVPIGMDPQQARLVTVRGTQGYVIGDETGLGSGVVWLENGFVMGVVGPLAESDLISLVNGLR